MTQLSTVIARRVQRAEGQVWRYYFSHENYHTGFSRVQAGEVIERLSGKHDAENEGLLLDQARNGHPAFIFGPEEASRA